MLILCCIATPTPVDQLMRRLFIACFIGCFSVCFLLRLGHVDCALYCLVSQSGAFTVCALLQQLRCCSLHSSCFTPCFDLTNSGEQCNRPSQSYHQWINHESSMTISRCQASIDHYESIVNHKNTTIIAKNQPRINPNFKMRVKEEDHSKGARLPRPGFW